MVQNVPKRNVFVELPLLGSTLFIIRKKLQIVFKSPVRDKSFFIFKGKLPKIVLLGFFYTYKCVVCNATYYGKTKCYFKIRIFEHLGISSLTGEKIKD